MLIENPPYPYSIVGLLPSSGRFFFAVRKNGTRVPSFEVADRAFVSKRLVSTGGVAASNPSLFFDTGLKTYTVDGVSGELKLYQISGASWRPLMTPTAPAPGTATSPCGAPSRPKSS